MQTRRHAQLPGALEKTETEAEEEPSLLAAAHGALLPAARHCEPHGRRAVGGSDSSLPRPLPGKSSKVYHPLLGQARLFPAAARCQVSGQKCLLCPAKEQSFQSLQRGNRLSYANLVRPAACLPLKC